MKHYGDITKINGSEVEIVDVIVGGSPCQDLSVAGKRAGLDGARSGLFMEQVRIVKEMREHDKLVKLQSGRANEPLRPRYMVWENVCGAFSSNSGEDFRIVLEETARIADESIVIPRPPKGKWSLAGCIMADGWSLAWRTTDNQYWGTPQRRRRLALVIDLNGGSAAEVLFESNRLSGNTQEGGQEREGTPATSEGHPDAASYTLKVRGGCEFDRYGKRAGKGALVQTELSGTLGVSQDQTLITTVQGIGIGNGQANQAMGDKLGTLNCMHDQQAVMVLGLDNYNQVVTGDKTHPIRSKAADSDHIPCVMGADIYNQKLTGDVSASLTCNANATSTQPTVITYGLDRASFNQGQNAQYDFAVEEELAPTVLAKGPGGGISQRVGALCARDYKGVGNQYVDEGKCVIQMLPKDGSPN